MKVYYSILYASIKPIVKEQLSIGLFMSNGKESFFHYSHEKLNLTKKLLTHEGYTMIKEYLEGLSQDINSETERNYKHDSPEYLNYLSNYSNNLISFSKPTSISIDFNKDNFKKLFEKFIFTYIEEIPYVIRETPLSIVKEELYPKIEKRVNWNKTLTPKEIPSLVIPKVMVSFIGRNDRPVAGDVIDFTAGITSISNHISHFVTLIKALENKPGKYYVIGEEPDKKQLPEHYSTWKHLIDSKLVDFVPVDETEKVSNYMDLHDVKPFIIGI